MKSSSSPISEKTPILGILGGLGPMASVYFYELLTLHTKASKDSDHLNLILSSYASTPDRTAFILGKSNLDPSPTMCAEAKKLEDTGANLIAVPCNTAHFFYKQIIQAVSIPVLNIIEETVKLLSGAGIRQIGLLATEGTVCSHAYHDICRQYGISCCVPSNEHQAQLNHLIYGQIKKGIFPHPKALDEIAKTMQNKGCDRLVLGCTELSLLDRNCELNSNIFVDSLKILAYRTILACGKEPVGFPEWFYQCS